MKTTAIALIVSMLAISSTAFAQEAGAWRTVADSIPLGSKVKVHTSEGKRISGTLMRVDDTSVLVKRNSRLPEPAVTITFESMANLERDQKGGGVNLGKAMAIGAATGAGFILAMFAIAFQLD